MTSAPSVPRRLRAWTALLLLGGLIPTGCDRAKSPAAEGVAGASAAAPAAAPGRRATGLVDVASTAGLRFRHEHGGDGRKFLFETMGSGVAASDFDGDGLPDLLFLQSGSLPADEFSAEERTRATHASGGHHALYLNEGDWRFRDATAGSGLEQPVYAMGLAVGDIDADGDRDLFVGCYGEDQLFVNDGSARFADAPAALGPARNTWTIGGAFFDADLDGDLDLYELGYLVMPVATHRFCGPDQERRTYCHVDSWRGQDDRLLLNDGSGRFHDGSLDAGLPGHEGKGLAVVTGDYDDDGDVDLFVANDSTPNLVLRNDGDGRFHDVGAMSGADLNGEGRTEACMGTDMGDLDGDGDLDMYVVNFEQETNTLYRNDGGGFFTDVSVLSGAGAPSLRTLGFGAVFVDLENDGDLDIYVANGHIMDNAAELEEGGLFAQPDHVFFNDGSGRFDLAPDEVCSAALDWRVGRGVARADFDRDGDHDLVVTNSAGAPFLLRNDLGRGHRLVLSLAGRGGRADAEGARVTVRAGGRTWMRELHGGGSYLSHSDSELIVGLGDLQQVDSVTIRWPDGTLSEHGDLAVDARHCLAAPGTLLSSEALPEPGAGR